MYSYQAAVSGRADFRIEFRDFNEIQLSDDKISLQDGDYSSIFVPIYDQSGGQPNGPGTMIPTAAQQNNAIYQQSGTVAVMPLQYPHGNGPAIYPGQFVYAPEQYTAAPGAPSTQIPLSYPTISYSYPCNGN